MVIGCWGGSSSLRLRQKLHDHGIQYSTPLSPRAAPADAPSASSVHEGTRSDPCSRHAHGYVGINADEEDVDEAGGPGGPPVQVQGGGSLVHGGAASLLVVQGQTNVHRLYNLLLELPHQDDVPSLLSPQVARLSVLVPLFLSVLGLYMPLCVRATRSGFQGRVLPKPMLRLWWCSP